MENTSKNLTLSELRFFELAKTELVTDSIATYNLTGNQTFSVKQEQTEAAYVFTCRRNDKVIYVEVMLQ
jgi:hypothetical protein